MAFYRVFFESDLKGEAGIFVEAADEDDLDDKLFDLCDRPTKEMKEMFFESAKVGDVLVDRVESVSLNEIRAEVA